MVVRHLWWQDAYGGRTHMVAGGHTWWQDTDAARTHIMARHA